MDAATMKRLKKQQAEDARPKKMYAEDRIGTEQRFSSY